MGNSILLLQYVGEYIAQFCGGLFAGALMYVCLTERPPRTMLGFGELLALSRANAGRTNLLLGALALSTAIGALLSAFTGAGKSMLAGGVLHLLAFAIIVTKVSQLAKRLHDLGDDREFEVAGHKLLAEQTKYLSALCLIGLVSEYLFIVRL